MNARHYDHQKLSDARELMGMTQQQLANELKVDRQTIYRAEAGKSVSYELLAEMCGYFRIPITSVVYPHPETIAA